MGRKDKTPQQNNTNSIGMQLRAARQSKNLSLTTMAEMLDYSVGYLSGIENGKHEVPEGLILRYEDNLGLERGELGEFVQAHKKVESLSHGHLWGIPIRNPFFTDRDVILDDIHNRLRSSASTSHVLAIVGLSGVGKTQLSMEYAYRYGNKYGAIFWLKAESLEDLTASCIELARDLDLREKDSQDGSITVEAVRRWLAEERSGSLIILDNVEDLRSLGNFPLQLGENFIIITTRVQAVGPRIQTIVLKEMNTQEGMLLLLRRAKIISPNTPLSHVSESSLDLARRISEMTAGLPIALDQAGAYLEETGCGLLDYLHLLASTQKNEFNRSTEVLYPYLGVVARTWLLSFEKIREINLPASELLLLCAFLGTDKIYKELFTEAGPSVGPTIRTITTDPFKLHQAIAVLRNYSLVRTDDESGALLIHRLVQAVIRDSLPPEEQQTLVERAVKVVNQVFPMIKSVRNWSEIWAKCQRYFPQADACIAIAEQWEIKGEDISQLLNKTGRYLEERTHLDRAEEMYQRALLLDKQYYGDPSSNVATDLGNLAMLYEKQGKIERAEKFYEQAFSVSDHMGRLENLEPTVLKHYIKLLLKKERNEKINEVQQYITPSSDAQKRILKRTPINDNDDRIIYHKISDWSYKKERGVGDFGDDVHITNVKDAFFTFEFEGTGIEIISDTVSAQGVIKISIDDTYTQTTNIARIVDKLTQTIVFSKTDLEFARHTLKVELVSGTFILDALATFSYEEE